MMRVMGERVARRRPRYETHDGSTVPSGAAAQGASEKISERAIVKSTV
jgi:hypothetical protein